MNTKEEKIQKAVGSLKELTHHEKLQIKYVPRKRGEDGIVAVDENGAEQPFTEFEDLKEQLATTISDIVHDGFVDPGGDGEAVTNRCKSIEVTINVVYDPTKR